MMIMVLLMILKTLILLIKALVIIKLKRTAKLLQQHSQMIKKRQRRRGKKLSQRKRALTNQRKYLTMKEQKKLRTGSLIVKAILILKRFKNIKIFQKNLFNQNNQMFSHAINIKNSQKLNRIKMEKPNLN